MNNTLKISLSYFMLFTFLLVANSCSKESEHFETINDYILNLDYDKASLLNVKNISGSLERTSLGEIDTDHPPVRGKYLDCKGENFSLQRNFDDITVLRPTNGVVWPGALVYADENLWKGAPRPITLDRAKMKLRIDLPGMRSDGTIEIDNAENSSVQTKIDETLEWWNDNAYEEGYVNSSASEYESSIVHSTTQLGLEVGMNVEWATGAVSSQLDYDQSSDKRVAVMVFKQVFYNITMDTPDSPADVFSNNVSLMDVQNSMDASAPPAYISNVSYGRIVMFRMEVENVSQSIDLEAVLSYASGVNGDVQVNSQYDEVLSRSTIKVITIGGDAEVASEAVSATGISSLHHILTGENAVYSRNNPGVPIAYTVKFLKDNVHAQMGYSTTYALEDCVTKTFTHERIYVDNDYKHKNIRVEVTYLKADGKDDNLGWDVIKDEKGAYLDAIPAGAYDLKIFIQKYDGIIKGWEEVYKCTSMGHATKTRSCFRAYMSGNSETAGTCSGHSCG